MTKPAEELARLAQEFWVGTLVAHPVEATALGNVLIQARARGLIGGDLETLRALVRGTQEIRRFEPRTAIAQQRA